MSKRLNFCFGDVLYNSDEQHILYFVETDKRVRVVVEQKRSNNTPKFYFTVRYPRQVGKESKKATHQRLKTDIASVIIYYVGSALYHPMIPSDAIKWAVNYNLAPQ